MKKFKKGFTLAEILIVLTIIGVMAVMTIPSLIQNSNSQQKIALFKKGFNAVSNAYATEFAIKTPPNSDAISEREKMWEALNNQLNVKYYVNAENGNKIYTLQDAKNIAVYNRFIVTEDKIGYKIGTGTGTNTTCYPKLTINSQKNGTNYLEKSCIHVGVYIGNKYTNDDRNWCDGKELTKLENCNYLVFGMSTEGFSAGNPDCTFTGRLISGKTTYESSKCQ